MFLAGKVISFGPDAARNFSSKPAVFQSADGAGKECPDLTGDPRIKIDRAFFVRV